MKSKLHTFTQLFAFLLLFHFSTLVFLTLFDFFFQLIDKYNLAAAISDSGSLYFGFFLITLGISFVAALITFAISFSKTLSKILVIVDLIIFLISFILAIYLPSPSSLRMLEGGGVCCTAYPPLSVRAFPLIVAMSASLASFIYLFRSLDIKMSKIDAQFWRKLGRIFLVLIVGCLTYILVLLSIFGFFQVFLNLKSDYLLNQGLENVVLLISLLTAVVVGLLLNRFLTRKEKN